MSLFHKFKSIFLDLLRKLFRKKKTFFIAQSGKALIQKSIISSQLGKSNILNVLIHEQQGKAAVRFKLMQFNSARSFYNQIKDYHKIFTEAEVQKIVNDLGNVDNPQVCPCVHGMLNRTANSAYHNMIPAILKRNPNYFNTFKDVTDATHLIFREGENLILSI